MKQTVMLSLHSVQRYEEQEAEELELVSGESDILLTDKEGKVREIARHRDIIMR